jgi:putative ABC transport system permease protein
MEKFKDLVKAAISDFRRNKARTILTSLGIMIGVFSVVMLIALGLGLKNYIQGQFESLGANLLMIMPGSGFGSEGGFGAGMMGGSTVKFDEKDVSAVSRISGVEYAVPLFFTSAKASANGNEKTGYFYGVSEDYFKLMNKDLSAGDFFTKADVSSKAKVAVLGNSIAVDLFGNVDDAIGKTVRLKGLRLKVVGIMERLGDPDQDSAVIIPYKTTFGSVNPDKTFWSLYVGVTNKEDVEAVKDEIKTALGRRYDKEDFSVTEQSELLSMINQIFTILNMVLVVI